MKPKINEICSESIKNILEAREYDENLKTKYSQMISELIREKIKEPLISFNFYVSVYLSFALCPSVVSFRNFCFPNSDIQVYTEYSDQNWSCSVIVFAFKLANRKISLHKFNDHKAATIDKISVTAQKFLIGKTYYSQDESLKLSSDLAQAIIDSLSEEFKNFAYSANVFITRKDSGFVSNVTGIAHKDLDGHIIQEFSTIGISLLVHLFGFSI